MKTAGKPHRQNTGPLPGAQNTFTASGAWEPAKSSLRSSIRALARHAFRRPFFAQTTGDARAYTKLFPTFTGTVVFRHSYRCQKTQRVITAKTLKTIRFTPILL